MPKPVVRHHSRFVFCNLSTTRSAPRATHFTEEAADATVDFLDIVWAQYFQKESVLPREGEGEESWRVVDPAGFYIVLISDESD